jgi:PAS domain S-box-containing protein
VAPNLDPQRPTVSLRSYLLAVAALLAVIFASGAALILRELEDSARERSGEQLLHTTRALSLAVAGDLETYRGMLLGLRQSEALQRNDWAAFDRQARQLLSGDSEAWIVVGDRAGRQLVNTRLPPGAQLPRGPGPAHIWPTLDRGESRVCDLTNGRVTRHIVCVDVPVMRDGRAAYHLSVVFRPAALQRRLEQQALPGTQTASILDSRGAIIWRTRSPDRFVGHTPPKTLLTKIGGRSQGLVHDVTLEGVPSLFAFSRPAGYGWTVMVSVPDEELRTGGHETRRFGIAVLVGCLLLGAAVAAMAGRRVTSAVQRLASAADRIRAGRREPLPSSGLREVDAVAALLDAALTERETSEERFRLAQDVGGIGSWAWDIAADEGHVSDSYKRMHGLEHIAGPLRFAQVTSVIHPDDRAAYVQRVSEGIRRREASTLEYRVIREDRTVRWIMAKGRPVFSPEGEPVTTVGVVIDHTERKQAEDKLRLLMLEVDHRANNLMTVVQGAVRLSRAGPGEELREIILGRVDALARAHHLLAASRWQGADLRRLVEEEMLQYTLGDPGRVRIEGESLPLSPEAAQGVAMAVHELATNAGKYGALFTASGRVHIAWQITEGTLRIRWSESGGPVVTPPRRKGFGSAILERALGGSIGGRSTLNWDAEGLTCELELPLRGQGGAGEKAARAPD